MCMCVCVCVVRVWCVAWACAAGPVRAWWWWWWCRGPNGAPDVKMSRHAEGGGGGLLWSGDSGPQIATVQCMRQPPPHAAPNELQVSGGSLHAQQCTFASSTTRYTESRVHVALESPSSLAPRPCLFPRQRGRRRWRMNTRTSPLPPLVVQAERGTRAGRQG